MRNSAVRLGRSRESKGGVRRLSNLAIRVTTESSPLPKLDARFRRFLDELDRSEGCVAGHSATVCKLTLTMARALGVADDDLPLFALGALMHDIGKVFVGERLLSKAMPLTEAEFETLRLHPLLGEALLAPTVTNPTVLGIVRWHHERWDGAGYPDGLGGCAIPLGARIVGTADAFIAMREARPYRRALGLEEAVDELQRVSGRQFDSTCVDVLVGSFGAEGPASRGRMIARSAR
jgi:HD-GYP domain-containing protein (c-di-GMP phosphodiesterase class II)